ncbi:hypothetical protein LFM09_46395 [Lentzea alba]|uniref:hypothetical protein n=1 Tax=Lentzea alba TaxID=2714351 RepID=UPI0039BF7CA3
MTPKGEIKQTGSMPLATETAAPASAAELTTTARTGVVPESATPAGPNVPNAERDVDTGSLSSRSDTDPKHGTESGASTTADRDTDHDTALLIEVNSQLRRWGWPETLSSQDLSHTLARLSTQDVTLPEDTKGRGRLVAETVISGTIARQRGGIGSLLTSLNNGTHSPTPDTPQDHLEQGHVELGDVRLRAVPIGDFYRLGDHELYIAADAVNHGTPDEKRALGEQVQKFLGDGLTLHRGVPAWHPDWHHIRNGVIPSPDGNLNPDFTDRETSFIPFTTDLHTATTDATTHHGPTPADNLRFVTGYNPDDPDFPIGMILTTTLSTANDTPVVLIDSHTAQVGGPIVSYHEHLLTMSTPATTVPGNHNTTENKTDNRVVRGSTMPPRPGLNDTADYISTHGHLLPDPRPQPSKGKTRAGEPSAPLRRTEDLPNSLPRPSTTEIPGPVHQVVSDLHARASHHSDPAVDTARFSPSGPIAAPTPPGAHSTNDPLSVYPVHTLAEAEPRPSADSTWKAAVDLLHLSGVTALFVEHITDPAVRDARLAEIVNEVRRDLSTYGTESIAALAGVFAEVLGTLEDQGQSGTLLADRGSVVVGNAIANFRARTQKSGPVARMVPNASRVSHSPPLETDAVGEFNDPHRVTDAANPSRSHLVAAAEAGDTPTGADHLEVADDTLVGAVSDSSPPGLPISRRMPTRISRTPMPAMRELPIWASQRLVGQDQKDPHDNRFTPTSLSLAQLTDLADRIAKSDVDQPSQACIYYLEQLGYNLYVGGPRPAAHLDDSTVGTIDSRYQILPGPGWTRRSDSSDITTALLKLGRTGWSAFVLGSTAHAKAPQGHAIVAHYSNDRGVVWIDPQRKPGKRVTASPPSHLTSFHMIVTDATGRAMRLDLPENPESHSTPSASIDPQDRVMYTGIGGEYEKPYELIAPKGWVWRTDQPLVSVSGILDIMPEHMGIWKDSSGRTYQSKEDARAQGVKAFSESCYGVEIVDHPIAAIEGDDGRAAFEKARRWRKDVNSRLANASSRPNGSALVDVFPSSQGYKVAPNAREVRVKGLRGHILADSYSQFTLGTPIDGVSKLFEEISSLTGIRTLKESTKFGERVALNFIEQMIPDSSPAYVKSTLLEHRSANEVRSFATLLYSQIVATLEWIYEDLAHGLIKHHAPVACRTSLDAIWAVLTSDAQDYFNGNQDYLVDELVKLYHSRRSDFVRKVKESKVIEETLRDDPNAPMSRDPNRFLENHVRLVLTSAVDPSYTGSFRGQRDVIGMNKNMDEMDTNEGRMKYPLLLLELREVFPDDTTDHEDNINLQRVSGWAQQCYRRSEVYRRYRFGIREFAVRLGRDHLGRQLMDLIHKFNGPWPSAHVQNLHSGFSVAAMAFLENGEVGSAGSLLGSSAVLRSALPSGSLAHGALWHQLAGIEFTLSRFLILAAEAAKLLSGHASVKGPLPIIGSKRTFSLRNLNLQVNWFDIDSTNLRLSEFGYNPDYAGIASQIALPIVRNALNASRLDKVKILPGG